MSLAPTRSYVYSVVKLLFVDGNKSQLVVTCAFCVVLSLVANRAHLCPFSRSRCVAIMRCFA